MSGWPIAPQEPQTAPAPAPMTEAERNALIAKWKQDKQISTIATETERASRLTVANVCFPSPVKGTNRLDLGNGYSLKLVFGYTYTLGDKTKTAPNGGKVPVNEQVEAVLDAMGNLGNEGMLIAERCIRWVPELVASEYLELNANNPTHMACKSLIDSILTTKPSTPQLTFEEPKVK